MNFLLQVGGDPYSDQFCDTASATESVGPLALWRVSNPSAIQSSSKEALDPGQLKLMRRVALVYNPLLEIWGVFPPPLRMCSDRCILTGRIYSTAFFWRFFGYSLRLQRRLRYLDTLRPHKYFFAIAGQSESVQGIHLHHRVISLSIAYVYNLTFATYGLVVICTQRTLLLLG